MLYGGAEVEAGMEAEAERSMLRTGVSVVVVNDGEQTRGGGGWLKTGATGLIVSADKMKKRIVPYSSKIKRFLLEGSPPARTHSPAFQSIRGG